MGKTTKILYADSTNSPTVGCAGCELYSPDPKTNICYAATLVNRYKGLRGWPKDFLHPEFFPGRLEEALRWRNLRGTHRPGRPWMDGFPRIIFLGDMADIFAENMEGDADPHAWLWPRLEDIAATPHIWLILTKRVGRMARFFLDYGRVPNNVWLGATVTGPNTIRRAMELAKLRRQYFPDLHTWLSLEPVLEDVRLSAEALGCIDWAAIGGASGKRPLTDPAWIESALNQCQSAGVPAFFKQWGAGNPISEEGMPRQMSWRMR